MNTVERIKNLCKERGISTHKLEMECGFANGYISSLKEGKIPTDRALTISRYFNTTLDYLIMGIESSKIPEYDTRFMEVIDLFSGLDEAQKMAVMVIMKGMQK